MAHNPDKAIPARSRLLNGCALASAMLAVANTPQSLAAIANPGAALQGDIQSVPLGSATFQNRSGVLDTINISAAQTVINWSTFDTATGGGPITFLAGPATAVFQNDPTSLVTNFTVLNRILPTDATRAIKFDGTIRSQINGQTGGSVWFYTPGGIILGPTATFDVGNLVLSAADIDTSDNNLFGTNGTIRFRSALDGTAAVDINAGARILASSPGSYVALVAPRINQSGNVTVNGSVGYIAAEQVDVRINNGLFDIEFLQGTGASATPIIHDGVTTGPGPDINSGSQRIYLAAYPKNDAITLLVTGGLGFGAADAAYVDRGQVVLSAGLSVSDLGAGSGTGLGPSTTVADIRIGTDTSADLTFTSGLTARASHDVIISPRAGFKLDFQRDLTVFAGHLADIGANETETILVGQNLDVASDNLGAGAQASVYALATPNSGLARGTVNIAANLFVFGGPSTAGGTQTATAKVTVDGGSLNVGQFAGVDATDQSFSQRATNAGTASVDIRNGGSMVATNGLRIRADAISSGFGTDDARAGTATLTAVGGTLNTSDLFLSAAARAGNGANASGGTASVSLKNANTLNLGNLFIGADAAVGGEGGARPGGSLAPSGGIAPSAPGRSLLTGGNASLTVDNTTLNIGTLDLLGSANGAFGSAGSDAVGGNATIDVISGTLRSQTLSLRASAVAERGSSANDDATPLIPATSGGNATGGTARLTISGGTVEANRALLEAVGTGGNGGAGSLSQAAAAGGNGQGGTAETLQTGGVFATQLVSLNSGAGGGSGGSAAGGFEGGVGGSGTGGISRLTLGAGGLFDFLDLDNGTTTVQVNLDSTGTGGSGGDQVGTANGGTGGAGLGGATTVSLSGAFATSTVATGQTISLVAEGFGGLGGNIVESGTDATEQVGGVGGAGTGGSATVTLARPNTNISTLSVFSDGGGGGGGSRTGLLATTGIGGLGGGASGGIANVTINANAQIGDLGIDASARGGVGGNAATGGNSGNALNTGRATLNVLNSTATIANVNITSSAFGSIGGIGQAGKSGAGGNASGGSSAITTRGTVDANGNPVTFGNLFITNLAIASDATGGDGAAPSPSGSGNGGGGGDATGGSSIVSAFDVGQIAISNGANVSAFASGGRAAAGSSNFVPGNGGVGGNATGGTSLVDNVSGLISAQNLSLDSDGDGGSGGAGGETGYGVSGRGGKGGSGTGGIALANNIEISGTGGSAFIRASGSGGQAGSGAVGGAGGLGKGGTASLSLLGSTISLNQLSVAATGFGADGGLSSVGIGANGGSAFGGTATAIVGGTSNSLIISAVNVNSSATGGTGSVGGAAQAGGSGGDAVAGNASFTIAAGQFSSSTLNVIADGTGAAAAAGANGSDSNGLENAGNGGRGGSGTGGSARLQIANAANVSTSILLLRSNGVGAAGAIGGNGQGGTGGNGGIGGSGTGGSVFLNLLGGSTLTSGEGFPTYDLLATGIAGAGGSGGDGSSGFVGGNGADGGNAAGGRGSLLIEGNASPVSLNVDIRAVAGAGGAAGVNDATTILTAGKGGSATGGFGQITTNGGTTVIGALTINNTTRGGDGGSANGYGSGGDGGDATGATTQILASGGALTLGDLVLTSNAIGGSGGSGTSAPFAPPPAANGSDGAAGVLGTNGGSGGDGTAGANGVAGANGGNGGKGGNGTGGLINVISNGAILTTGNITANANGFGGFGGNGGNGSDGGRGGNGGIGGIGASNFNFSPPNDGGNGGNGGDAGNGGSGGNGGAGGAGGIGFGGSILLRTQDGTLATGNLTLTANGTGALAGVQGGGGLGGSAGLPGNGGARGESGYGTPGTAGQRGAFGSTGTSGDQGLTPRLFQLGFGGQINIASQGVELGSTLTAGIASLTANGLNSQIGLLGDGGDITISNAKGSVDQPDVVFERLTAESNGLEFGSINFDTKNANVLSNINTVGSTTGDINVRAEGTGELRALGNIVLQADGNFTATHSERAPDGATVRSENVNIIANGVFDAQAGSLILARDSIYVQSLSSRLSAANLTAAAFITAVAGADLTIGNATTTDPAQPNTLPVFPGLITLQAGFLGTARVPANLTVNGAVTSTGDTLLMSGGDIVINGSAVINSNNRIVLSSGDDIFINDGASLTSGLDPIPENGYGATGSLEIAAGSISVDAGFPDFVHSIIIGNANLTATNNILKLSAEAIQANGAQFQSGQFSALINNAPASFIIPSDDGGQLSADCVQGNICLGKVTATFDSNFTNATGTINIGPVSGTVGLPNSVTVVGDLQGKDITVRARDSITLGQTGLLHVYEAGNGLFVSALNGDITLNGPALIRAGLPDIKIFAGGSIFGPQANLGTPGEVGLYAGGNINLGRVSTTGYLQTIDSVGNVTNPFQLDVPGSVTIGNLQAIASADIRSGGDISLGDVSGVDAITLSSIGNTTITGSTDTRGDLFVNAGNASSIATANADKNVFVLAGGNADFGTANAGESIGVRAVNLTASSLTAGEDVTIRPTGTVNITSASAGDDFEIFGGSTVNVGSGTARGTGPDGGELQFNANSITRISSTGGGDGSDIDIEAGGSVTVGDFTAADDIFLSALRSVTATGLLKTTGTPFSSVAGDNDIEIFNTIASVSLTAVDSASDFVVNSLSFTASGAINAKEDVELRIIGPTNAGAITAGDDIIITTSNALTLGALTTNLTGPDDESDGHLINLTAATLTLSSAASAGALTITTMFGDLVTGNLLAANDVALTSAAKVNSGDITATGGNIRINARTGITSGNLSAPLGSVLLNNLSGDILTALITVRDDFTLSNGGLITLGGVTAGDDVTITAGSTATLGDLLSTGAGTDNENNGSNIVIAGPSLNFRSINAARNASISGGTISGGPIMSGAATSFAATNTFAVSAITAGTSVSGNADFGFTASGLIQAGTFIDVTGRSVNATDINAGSTINLTAQTGPITTRNIVSGSSTTLNSATLISTGSIKSQNSDITLDAQGAITTGDLTALLGSVSISNTLGTITTGLIGVGNDFTLNTGSDLNFAGVSVGDDIRITTRGSATLGTLLAKGTGKDSESDGSNIFLNIGGAADVTHGEAVDDFSATTARFATGLNSLITGGDIIISTSGDSLLGNSTAGGFISVSAGGLIDFNVLNSGGVTQLFAGNTVIGSSTTSGQALTVSGPNGVNIASVNSGGNVNADVNTGDLIVTNATAIGSIRYSNTGTGAVIANSATSGGDVEITSGGTVALANLRANGGFNDPQIDGIAKGDVFVIAAGNASVGNATATAMLGIQGANIVSSGTLTAGEDILVMTDGAAMLSNLQAGDNIDIVSVGGISLTAAVSTGASRDDRSLSFESGYGGNFFQINSAIPDGGDISLRSFGAGVSVANLTAADDIGINAMGRANVSGLAKTLGTGATNGSSSIVINAATASIAASDAFSNLLVDAFGDIALGTSRAANLIEALSSNGSISLNTLTSGGDILLHAAQSISGGSATANNGIFGIAGFDVVVQNLTATNGNVMVRAQSGGVTATMLNAGLDLSVDASSGGISLASGTAARDVTYVTNASGNIAATSTMAGDDILISSAGGVTLGTAKTTGQFVESGYGTTPDGSNLTIIATAPVSVGTGTATDNVTITGQSLNATTLGAGGMLVGTVVQSATVGSGSGTKGVTLTAGQNLTTGAATSSTGAVQLTATNGALDFGTTTANTNVTLIAAGAAQGLAATATTGGVTVTAASLDARSVTAGTNISATITNLAKSGTAKAGATVALTAGTIDIGSVEAGTLTSTSSSSSSFGTIATTGNATANANSGGLTTGNVSAGGALSLTSKAAGSITTGNVSGGAGVTLISDNLVKSGSIAASGGNVGVTAVNAVDAGAVSAGGTGANIAVNSGGDVNLASATAASNIAISAVNLTAPVLSAGNDISATLSGTATLGTVTGSGVFDGASLATINAARGITIQRTDVKGGVDLTATGGGVLVSTDLKASGTVNAAGRAIDLTSLGALALGNATATDGDIKVTAGSLTANQASARGDLRLTTTSGDIVAGTLTTGAGVGASAGGAPGPADIILTSASSVTLNGAANAQRNLNVTAARRLSVNGQAIGTVVDVRSSDITIGSTAAIGQQGRTTSVTLNNVSNSVTTIGGSGVTTGYSLSNAEAQRIFAGDIIIIAPRLTASNTDQVSTALNSRAPDVILDTLTLTGTNGQTGTTAGNIGSNGRLRIQTAGKLRTVGAVLLTNLTNGTRFQIAADETIEVDAATGSISLRGASNALGGTLELASADVIAASLTNIAAVGSASDTKAISDRLGLNDGAVLDDGYLSANAITVNVANGFYVQNSGAVSPNLRNFRDRRGLTVGEGGLSINTRSPTARIVINGRQVSATAVTGFATGIDFLKLVTFNGNAQGQNSAPSGLFDLDSTINGCAILNPATCQVNFDNGNITRDVINNLTEEERRAAEGDGALPFTLLSIKDVEGLPFQPVIDDPVTGSGNDDLWAIDDAKKCTVGETCEK